MNKYIITVLELLMAGMLMPTGAAGQETPAARKGSVGTFALSTNAVDYANLGTLNLEASYAVSPNWSLAASAKYNPFTYRQMSYALGARWWPWRTYSGWWMSGNVRYQQYNSGGYRSGSYQEEETSEGDRYGGGVGGGYSYMLSKHFNLDFGLGFWAGYETYVSYACPRCGRPTGSGDKFFVRPSDFLISVSYLF